jgi:hypothetical protein
VRRPLNFLLRAAFGFAVGYALWLPLQPTFGRLLAATTAPILRLLDDPPLVSFLVASEDAVLLYSFLTGFHEPMAAWNVETLGVFLLAPVVLALATPGLTRGARAAAVGVALGGAFLLTLAIAVTQIRLIVLDHATRRLGIAVLPGPGPATLDRLNGVLHAVGMLGFPALVFCATYAWGLWLPPPRRDGARAWRLPALTLGAVAVGWALLAAVPEAGRRPEDYHRGWAEVLRLNPGFAPAQVNVALWLQSEGRLDEAVELYRAAIESRPDLVGAHYNLGNALLELHRPQEAVQSYAEVVQREPGHAPAQRNLGLALARLDRPCAAARALRESVRLDAAAGANDRLAREIERLESDCATRTDVR